MQTSPEQIAGYIKELAEQLAKQARRSGLHPLAFCLEMAVAEAAEIEAGREPTKKRASGPARRAA